MLARSRFHTSEIPIPLLVSSVVTHHCHHWPALSFRNWHPFTKLVLILTDEISSTFVPRCFPVLYPISRSGTQTSKSPPPSEVHRQTMGLEGGGYLYHKMTPPPNLGRSWVVFEGWSQILPSTKLFHHRFEQSCSAMVTQSWRKRYSNTMRLSNQANLAAGANREHMAKQGSAASGGALALELPLSHWIGPEQGRIFGKIQTNFNTKFPKKTKIKIKVNSLCNGIHN